MTDASARPDKSSLKATSSSQLRRAPMQERAKLQVQRILDAAAVLIAEVGVDVTTTNAIAARAKISVGTLYQYFPNKEALVRALAVRFLETLDAVLPIPTGEDPSQWSLPEEVGRAVQVLEQFIEEHPAFAHVYRAARGASDPASVRLLDRGKAHFEGVFARRAPWVPPDQRRAHATVVVEAAQSLLVIATSMAQKEHRQLVHELTTMLVHYLDPIYGDAARPWNDLADGRNAQS